MARIYSFTFNLFSEHTYILEGEGGECVIIDPGCSGDSERRELTEHLSSHCIKPVAILLTHGHADHVYGVKALQDSYGIPVYMSPDDQVELDGNERMAARFGMEAPDCSFSVTGISDGEVLHLAGMDIEVITTPGHTIGCACFLLRSAAVMFTGDTLFAGAIGRTDMGSGDYDKEIVSIMEKLILLDGDITIYPGHGGSSTIAHERTHNPFLEPFNEPEETFDPDLEGISINGR